MKDVKKDSSAWIKTKENRFRDFHWQEGYGAFSIGKVRNSRNVSPVRKNITANVHSRKS